MVKYISVRHIIADFSPVIYMFILFFQQILQMALEIADGMAYLSVKKYIHRSGFYYIGPWYHIILRAVQSIR